MLATTNPCKHFSILWEILIGIFYLFVGIDINNSRHKKDNNKPKLRISKFDAMFHTGCFGAKKKRLSQNKN